MIVFNVLATTFNLVLSRVFYDHLITVDVSHRLSVLSLLLLLRLLVHVVLYQLLGEWELVWVLLVLLTQVLQQHLLVVFIQLVQVYQHVFIVFTLSFTIVIFLLITVVLILFHRLLLILLLLLLNLLQLLLDIDV